jgi:hypothetical protein
LVDLVVLVWLTKLGFGIFGLVGRPALVERNNTNFFFLILMIIPFFDYFLAVQKELKKEKPFTTVHKR